jgi:hypothetical protein
MRPLTSLSALTCALLSACAVDPDEAFDHALDPSGLARVATNVRGCGDTTIAAANLADTQALFFNLPGLAAAANQAGHAIRVTLPLPDPNVSVRYQTGRRLTSTTCIGMPPPLLPRINAEYEAVGGTLYLDVTPTGGPAGMPTADIDLSLVDPAFANPQGPAFAVNGSIEALGVSVGFYPP